MHALFILLSALPLASPFLLPPSFLPPPSLSPPTSSLSSSLQSSTAPYLQPFTLPTNPAVSLYDLDSYLRSTYSPPSTLPLPYTFTPSPASPASSSSPTSVLGVLEPSMHVQSTEPTRLEVKYTSNEGSITVTPTLLPSTTSQSYTTSLTSPTSSTTVNTMVAKTVEMAFRDYTKYATASPKKVRRALERPRPVNAPAAVAPEGDAEEGDAEEGDASATAALTTDRDPSLSSSVSLPVPTSVSPTAVDIFSPSTAPGEQPAAFTGFLAAAEQAAENLMNLTPSPFFSSSTDLAEAQSYHLPSAPDSVPQDQLRHWLRLHKLATLATGSPSPLTAHVYRTAFAAVLTSIEDGTDLDQFNRLLAHDLYSQTMREYISSPPPGSASESVLTRVNDHAMTVFREIAEAQAEREGRYNEVVRDICGVVMGEEGVDEKGVTMSDRFR